MDRNKMLLDFASDWTLDGDLLRCRECERAQIASRQDEDFVHRNDCKKLRIGGRPWTVLQAILLTLPSGVSLVDQLAAVTAYRDGMIAAFSKLYGPEVQVDEHASTLARLIGDSHTLADIALELMDTEHGAEGSLAEAVRVLMSSLAAVTAQRDELLAAIAKWQRLEDASEEAWECWWEGMKASGGAEPEPELAAAYKASLVQVRLAQNEVLRIARAQPEQPQQPQDGAKRMLDDMLELHSLAEAEEKRAAKDGAP